MSNRTMVLCGVPKEMCSGGVSQVKHVAGNDPQRGHASAREAYACMVHHLVKTGYTRLGNHAFSPPGGGPVRVISKPSHYGLLIRNGKEGTRYMYDRHTKHGHRSARGSIAPV